MKKLILFILSLFLVFPVSVYCGSAAFMGSAQTVASGGACTTANDEEPINDGTTAWENLNGTSALTLNNGTSEQYAHSFTIDGSGSATITEVGVYSGWWSCSGDCVLQFEIQGNSTTPDRPDNTAITNGTGSKTISDTIDPSGCTGAAMNILTFSTAPTVTKGTKYWVVYWADSGDQINICRNTSGSHASETSYTENAGVSWTGQGDDDAHFKINGCD